MPIRLDELALKAAHIAEMIAAIRAKTIVVKRFGGATIASFADEDTFQTARLDFVHWLEGADEPAIRAKIADERAALGPDVDALIAGYVGGLPTPIVLAISRLELALLALGEHPAQLSRAAAAADDEGS
jgi:hypothetical protein